MTRHSLTHSTQLNSTHVNHVVFTIVLTFLVISYVWGAASISNVREHMFKFNKLKYLALLGALVSGFFEEILFRKILMD